MTASPPAPSNGNLPIAEHQFQLLVASVKDYAIFMLDPSGHVRSWNAGAQQIKGYLADEVIGKHISIFYTPEDVARGRPKTLLEAALARAASRTKVGACARMAAVSGLTSSSRRFVIRTARCKDSARSPAI